MSSSLRIVLFAAGIGSDVSSYKPDRDESQWWNRRDALVRCVTTCLFGPAQCELAILYDQDWSCMHMEYHSPPSNSPIPMEKTLVQLWKQAAQSPGAVVTNQGLSCCLLLSDHAKKCKDIPSEGSKREVLDYLQSSCSLEFLREHHLNSSKEVLLRKTNKSKLLEIAHRWKKRQSATQTDSHLALQSALERLVKPKSSQVTTVLTATLHESSEDELPCWDEVFDKTHHDPNLQICIFLGAVRDMLPIEYNCLEKVAKPLLRIRIGPVSEFTSKIVSVVNLHHSQHRLGPALLHLMRNHPNGIGVAKSNVQSQLHFVCLVPLEPDQISTQLEHRTFVLWCIVRCTVVTLWRSRLGGRARSPHEKLTIRLTFMFENGSALTLDQNDFVTSMSQQHQAAPSEYQILNVLQKLATKLPKSEKSIRRQCKEVLNEILANQAYKPSCVLNFSDSGHNPKERPLFYSTIESETLQDFSAIIILPIHGPQKKDSQIDERQCLLIRAAQQCDIPMLEVGSIVQVDQGSVDRHATLITALQHLAYQERLAHLIKRCLNEPKKSSLMKKSKRQKTK